MQMNHLFSYLFSNKRTGVIHHKAVVMEMPGSQGSTSDPRYYVRINDYDKAGSMVSFRI